MTALGKKGVKEVAHQNIQKAQYAKKVLEDKGLRSAFTGPFFNEFVIELKCSAKEVNQTLLESGIIGGYDLGLSYPELKNHVLIAVTEMRTKEEIDQLANVLEGLSCVQNISH
jgi:glycine dehydrogenase subunit 1